MADKRANLETEGHDRFLEWKRARFHAMHKLLIGIEESSLDDEVKLKKIVDNAKEVFDKYGITLTDTFKDEFSGDEDETPQKRLKMCVP